MSKIENVFTSSRPDLKNDGERRAHYESELRETCIEEKAHIDYI